MESMLIRLQEELAHQQDEITRLSDELYRQQREMHSLQQELARLKIHLSARDAEGAEPSRSLLDDKPPHW